MVGLDWSTSVVTQDHLQNLVSLGYMTVVELATCRVPQDPTSPVLVVGYVMACTLFYGLELHHLTHLGILHMAALVTLCEAYMRIEPHFNLWNSFFRTQLWQGLNVEVAVLGSVDIYV
jgi:hypothetical protein